MASSLGHNDLKGSQDKYLTDSQPALLITHNWPSSLLTGITYPQMIIACQFIQTWQIILCIDNYRQVSNIRRTLLGN